MLAEVLLQNWLPKITLLDGQNFIRVIDVIICSPICPSVYQPSYSEQKKIGST